MKFNWGTGIFVFLVIFLLASTGVIIFSLTQEVNLVHRDYYEKGTDHTEQMQIDARSVPFAQALSVTYTADLVRITFDESLASQIDSGMILLYRPSSSRDDISFKTGSKPGGIGIPKNELLRGRYIMKFSWYSEGVKYALEKPLNVE